MEPTGVASSLVLSFQVLEFSLQLLILSPAFHQLLDLRMG